MKNAVTVGVCTSDAAKATFGLNVVERSSGKTATKRK
jgi:hypothetical protein